MALTTVLRTNVLHCDYETERRENLTQSWEREMQYSDAIWWRHNKYKMADGRHIDQYFQMLIQ